ncbi:unnamed protein product [Coffea canephora]|uniref:Uncharacterized protein n=1 Tax=Coffea canephora TaxID=49390 RepID=A0A068UEX9_COFCA|nr:unnamed protein product [Coffea canephora]
MRIRRKSSLISASPSSSSSYSSPSPTSASSNCSSSSITANSLASSIDSSSSSTPPNFCPISSGISASSSSKRCQGLDLLVKAIHLVTAGSVVGVPYIQRRVVRRRKAAVKFNHGLILSKFQVLNREPEEEEMMNQVKSRTRSMSRRQSRAVGFPSKHQDSVLQTWMLKNRRQRSIKIGDEMCS